MCRACPIPTAFRMVCIISLVKWVPLSDSITSGTPNLQTISCRIFFAVDFAVAFVNVNVVNL